MIQIVTSGLIAVGLADMLANRAGPGGVHLIDPHAQPRRSVARREGSP